MRFRVRYTGVAHKLVIDDEADGDDGPTLLTLRKAVQRKMELGFLPVLSLNGKDILGAGQPDTVSLKSLGVAGGDLLRVLDGAKMPTAAARTSAAPRAPSSASASQQQSVPPPTDMDIAQEVVNRVTAALGAGAASTGIGINQLLSEAMAESFTSMGEGGPPPASKLALEELDDFIISQRQVDKGRDCSICQEMYILNEEVKRLPCQHLFHMQCIMPWFAKHNSCPQCRHELPTNDPAYEARKRMERREAEGLDYDQPASGQAIEGLYI